MPTIIVGIGSHAEVVQSILGNDGFMGFISFGDDIPKEAPSPYLGKLKEFSLHEGSDISLIVAIGDNHLRKQVVEEIRGRFPFCRFANVISKQSYIAEGVKIGVGNVVSPGAMIQVGATLGDHNIINTNSSIDHHCELRSFIHVAPNVAVCGTVTLHEGVFIGAGSTVTPKVVIRPWSFFKAQSLIKSSNSPIPIYDVFLRTKTCVQEALDSGWVSSRGKYIELAQKKLQELFRVRHVLLVSNGTCAAHCVMMALNHRYPTITKIYVPDNVYVAVWNSVLYEYPMEYLEVMRMNDSTLNIDTSEGYIKSLEANSAVLITHNVGNVVNVPRLKRLRPDLVFVEDACEAFGGSYEGIPVGSASLCASMSFFANKTLTGGELGAVLTNDDDLCSYLGKKINQGNSERRYVHEMLAYNYRATNLTAGLLCDQLVDMPEILSRKKRVFDAYEKHFPRVTEENTTPSNWIMPIRIMRNPSYDQAEIFFRNKAIDIRPMFYEINVHTHLSSISPSEVGGKIHREYIMVPSHPMLTDREVEYIITTIKEYQRLI